MGWGRDGSAFYGSSKGQTDAVSTFGVNKGLVEQITSSKVVD